MRGLTKPRALAWTALAVALAAAPASGDHVLPSGIEILAGVDGNPAMQMTITTAMLENEVTLGNLTLSEDPDGTFTLSGSSTFSMAAWELNLTQLALDQDPFVSFVSGFTNTTGSTQNFIFSTSIPIAPAITPSSLIGGDTVVTYQDADFSGTGSLANISGQAGYSGTIDGSDELDLLDPFVINAGDVPPSVFDTSPTPLPSTPGPQALSTIGITHRFTLSSQDNATFNSRFIVVVPEPGTALLVGLGCLGLAAIGRRRSSRG